MNARDARTFDRLIVPGITILGIGTILYLQYRTTKALEAAQPAIAALNALANPTSPAPAATPNPATNPIGMQPSIPVL